MQEKPLFVKGYYAFENGRNEIEILIPLGSILYLKSDGNREDFIAVTKDKLEIKVKINRDDIRILGALPQQ